MKTKHISDALARFDTEPVYDNWKKVLAFYMSDRETMMSLAGWESFVRRHPRWITTPEPLKRILTRERGPEAMAVAWRVYQLLVDSICDHCKNVVENGELTVQKTPRRTPTMTRRFGPRCTTVLVPVRQKAMTPQEMADLKTEMLAIAKGPPCRVVKCDTKIRRKGAK